jgi:hypothetical protein
MPRPLLTVPVPLGVLVGSWILDLHVSIISLLVHIPMQANGWAELQKRAREEEDSDKREDSTTTNLRRKRIKCDRSKNRATTLQKVHHLSAFVGEGGDMCMGILDVMFRLQRTRLGHLRCSVYTSEHLVSVCNA